MLDIPTYRLHENVAKDALQSWRMVQRNNLDVFEKAGVPVRLNSLAQLRQFLDTLQEGRFTPAMHESGGFTPEELSGFLRICHRLVDFQLLHFPDARPFVPLDSLMAAYFACQKIMALKPGFKTLLEIGPGPGLVAGCLHEMHSELANYSQVEACESYYLLQDKMNRFFYGTRFRQRLAATGSLASGALDRAACGTAGEAFQTRHEQAAPDWIDLPRAPGVVFQYPWWNLRELAEAPVRFEVAMANANLVEFTEAALEDYLALIMAKLAPDGIFFVQCFGGSAARSREYALGKLRRFGFAPAFFAAESTCKGSEVWASPDQFLGPVTGDPRRFVMSNAVFVRPGHPLYEQCHREENFRHGWHGRLEGLREAFFPAPEGRRIFTRAELVERIRTGRSSG